MKKKGNIGIYIQHSAPASIHSLSEICQEKIHTKDFILVMSLFLTNCSCSHTNKHTSRLDLELLVVNRIGQLEVTRTPGLVVMLTHCTWQTQVEQIRKLRLSCFTHLNPPFSWREFSLHLGVVGPPFSLKEFSLRSDVLSPALPWQCFCSRRYSFYFILIFFLLLVYLCFIYWELHIVLQ